MRIKKTFKVGDKVKIVAAGCSVAHENYYKMVGKTSEVIGVNDNILNTEYKVRCTEDSDDYWWFSEKELELVVESDDAALPILPHNDRVNHPLHYNRGKIEVIDFIEDQGLNFSLGNCVKYIARASHKGNKLEDLKKALWYLTREVEREAKTITEKE